MRLFVAIDVPDELKEHIERQVVEPLRGRLPGARWTRAEGRHLTLKFLGNVEESRVPEVAAALRDVASRHAGFDASFDEVGGFPNLKRPRVLWIGIGQGAEPMARLAADVDRSLEGLGFETEDRVFHGHFTLARFPKPAPTDALPALDIPDDRFAVTEIVLFQSQLHPKGARYTPVERAPLRPHQGSTSFDS